MYQRILVPLDGSDLAAAVLEHAVALAGKFEASVTLLQAITPVDWLRRDLLRGDLSALHIDLVTDVASRQVDAQRATAEHYLQQQVETLRSQGITVDLAIVEGEPATMILNYAREHAVDLIALATHGRGGLGRLVYGSVAEDVLRSAPCPVFLVRSLPGDSDEQ